jgi:acyl carrier protein
MVDRIVDLISRLIGEVWPPEDGDPPENLHEDTALLGPSGILSSMALVSLLLALEQEMEARHGAPVRLVDERAMSHRNSPFRTIGTLAAHAAERLRGVN